MLNRRHLRIKVLQALYAYFQADRGSVTTAQKGLFTSVDRIWYLYITFLTFFDTLLREAERQMEEGKLKKLPSESDLLPNLVFLEDPVIRRLADSERIQKEAEKQGVDLANLKEMAKKTFGKVVESERYQEFISDKEPSFEKSRSYVAKMFKDHVANSETMLGYLEDHNVYWVDDIDLVCGAVIKTVKKMDESSADVNLLPFYKDKKDDKKFVSELFTKTIDLEQENEKLIDEHSSNWELERIAMMDMLLMKMAVTEVRTFSSIPIKVTLNEYIEISKFYSTPKSNTFINGILDKLFAYLKTKGMIKKVGRGLIEQ